MKLVFPLHCNFHEQSVVIERETLPNSLYAAVIVNKRRKIPLAFLTLKADFFCNPLDLLIRGRRRVLTRRRLAFLLAYDATSRTKLAG